jgi:hypothetical protein
MAFIRQNPTRAPTNPIKAALGEKMPGQQIAAGLGGAHFAKPEFIAQGHNRGPGPGDGGHSKAHPGFRAVAAKIGRQSGIRNPGAVLAASTRHASAAAKRANPRLNRVK